jgi:hypothetical protein
MSASLRWQSSVGPQVLPAQEESFTVRISVNAIGANTVRAAVADRRWVITKLTLVTGATGNAVTIVSGATSLTGPMDFPANTIYTDGDGDHVILRASNVNEAFVITLTAAQFVNGWAQMREIGQR